MLYTYNYIIIDAVVLVPPGRIQTSHEKGRTLRKKPIVRVYRTVQVAPSREKKASLVGTDNYRVSTMSMK